MADEESNEKKPEGKKADKGAKEDDKPKGLAVVDYYVSKKDRDDYYRSVRKAQLAVDRLQELIVARSKITIEIVKDMASKFRDMNPMIYMGHVLPGALLKRLNDGLLTLKGALEEFGEEKLSETDMDRYWSQQDLINDQAQKLNEANVNLAKKANTIADEVDYIGPLPADIEEDGKIVKRAPPPPPPAPK